MVLLRKVVTRRRWKVRRRKGFWFFSDVIITLVYGKNFSPSINVLDILSAAVFLFFMNFLLSNVLITSGREKINAWNLVVATIFNIFLNMALIPEYGAEGAAWATVLCEGLLIVAMSLQIKTADPQLDR